MTEIATLTTDKEQLEKDVTRKREDLLTLEEALDKKAGDLSAVEESIAEKKTEKQRLAETVEGLERQIVAHTGSVSELETKINEKETRFAELQRDVLKVQGDLDDLEKDRETRKRALDDELRTVLIQTQDALTRLKELQETEDATRKSIANERLILDKERQSLLTLKAKLSGAEARYAKLNQMTKL